MIKGKRGLFIVFEGLDRSGKSTQVKLLKKYFDPDVDENVVRKARIMRFPDRSTEVGKEIDNFLSGKVQYTAEKIHELFARNRWELRDRIIEDLKKGTHIIVDRYAFSGVAYSSAKGLDFEWCKSHDKGLPKPDIVFFVNLSEDQIVKRAGFGEEVYEKKEFQQIVKEKYQKLHDSYWIDIDADADKETVHRNIVAKLEEYVKNHEIGEEIGELW